MRGKSANIITVYIDVEPVPFNRGFYSIDLTFFFEVWVDAFKAHSSSCHTVSGLATFNKKVILYGSEGSVKIFSSQARFDGCDTQITSTENLPTAVCQVADPIVLAAKLVEKCDCSCNCSCIPEHMNVRFGGNLVDEGANRVVLVSLGIFTIIQLERNVQMLVPVYDFCIPCKECVSTTDDPCDLFRKIKFPTDQFFPPKAEDAGEKGCRYHE